MSLLLLFRGAVETVVAVTAPTASAGSTRNGASVNPDQAWQKFLGNVLEKHTTAAAKKRKREDEEFLAMM